MVQRVPESNYFFFLIRANNVLIDNRGIEVEGAKIRVADKGIKAKMKNEDDFSFDTSYLGIDTTVSMVYSCQQEITGTNRFFFFFFIF